jgi:uncharacterized membrane protein
MTQLTLSPGPDNDAETADAAASTMPGIRRIGASDVWRSLAHGFRDFHTMPTHVVFLGLIYPIVGVILARATFGHDVVPLLFPLVAGFALIGPIAALGIYEISRRHEHGLEANWLHAFDVCRSCSLRSISVVGVLLLALFTAWLEVAQGLYQVSFAGALPDSFDSFVAAVLTTPAGWTMIVAGNAIGFCFAAVALALSVISLPMLLDRNVTAGTAIATSLRAVIANPAAMALWGLIVAASLMLGSLPCFVGLAIAVPVLGHATWHLYRKVVEV